MCENEIQYRGQLTKLEYFENIKHDFRSLIKR
jgi:hypothetical protein